VTPIISNNANDKYYHLKMQTIIIIITEFKDGDV